MHTFGSDFEFRDARPWFKNLDKLIQHINSTPKYKMKLKYSTPTEYFNTIKKENNSFTKKVDDFMPYNDN